MQRVTCRPDLKSRSRRIAPRGDNLMQIAVFEAADRIDLNDLKREAKRPVGEHVCCLCFEPREDVVRCLLPHLGRAARTDARLHVNEGVVVVASAMR
jgi:hypothetical protein